MTDILMIAGMILLIWNQGKRLLVTDEELENIKLLQCPSCNSKMTSVRRATQRWWLVGCVECFNKIQCERQYVEQAAAKFNEYARRVTK